jgi:flagellar motor switch/type III secretory pathway protein FliN
LSAPLAGLLAALCVEAARRSGVATSLLGAPPVGEEALLVDVTVVLEGRPFTLNLFVVGASHAAGPEPTLAPLGELELRVPLVVASVAVSREDLLTLEVGGALLAPAEDAIPAAGPVCGMLVAPQSERGIRVELRPDGRLVVGETAQARLTVERDKSSSTEGETLTDVLLDTPVVVRIELGAVSMSARDWARLGPGDVIETAQRIAEPVLLRVQGREVGRGELVNVDGQVGVRIQKLYEDS